MIGQIASDETVAILIRIPKTDLVNQDQFGKPIWLKIDHIIKMDDGYTDSRIKYLYLGRPNNSAELLKNKESALTYLQFTTPQFVKTGYEQLGYVVGKTDFIFPTVFEQIL